VTLIDEYNLFVEDTARLSDRRQMISNIYTAVNSILLAAVGLLIKDLGLGYTWKIFLSLPLIIAGIAVCLLWIQLIQKYKSLIELRIKVLRETEDIIPDSIRMYHQEDGLYPPNSKNSFFSISSFSDIESKLPLLFIVLYSFFGLGVLIFYIFSIHNMLYISPCAKLFN
jgi:hypothetical protein